MATRFTYNMADYINDYEKAAEDYARLGPLWAELVFPHDFPAMQAIFKRGHSPEKKRENPAWINRYVAARQRITTAVEN